MSPDKIEYLDSSSINGLNLYCYCFNNSINYIDYYGTDAIYVSLYGNAGLSTSLDSSYTGGALQAFCMDILLPLNNIYDRNRRLIY